MQYKEIMNGNSDKQSKEIDETNFFATDNFIS